MEESHLVSTNSLGTTEASPAPGHIGQGTQVHDSRERNLSSSSISFLELLLVPKKKKKKKKKKKWFSLMSPVETNSQKSPLCESCLNSQVWGKNQE